MTRSWTGLVLALVAVYATGCYTVLRAPGQDFCCGKMTSCCCYVQGSVAMLQDRVTTLSVCNQRFDHFRCRIWVLLLLIYVTSIIFIAPYRLLRCLCIGWLLTMQKNTQSK